ncbi:MAG: DNA repair protein RadA [Acidobacteria bacterium]|nr:DNA repair protein RadA [Acidobacteriota bacterium]
MAKRAIRYECSSCGELSSSHLGRCPSCEQWGTLVEAVVPTSSEHTRGAVGTAAVPVGEITAGSEPMYLTGLPELDRVLGGGLAAGSVTLLAGEPGIGKSTLLLQLLASSLIKGPVLYVSGEESIQQVAERAERIGADRADLLIMASTDLDEIVDQATQRKASVMVVDSIQTIVDAEAPGARGSVGQVRGCANRLVQLAKTTDITVVIAGHVTKDGSIAGPRVLEHIVDTVLELRGDRHGELRMLHAPKHRFGATGDVGVMSLSGEGLQPVPDLSAMCLAERVEHVPGSVVGVTLEGHRPLCVEVQSLVIKAHGNPRRSAQGLDSNRLQLVLAVIERRLGLVLGDNDVWASVVGGVRLSEPGGDLAVALAVASASLSIPLEPDIAAFGELGLAGELRQVARSTERVREAVRLGFDRILVPASMPLGEHEAQLIRVDSMAAAVRSVGLVAPAVAV